MENLQRMLMNLGQWRKIGHLYEEACLHEKQSHSRSLTDVFKPRLPVWWSQLFTVDFTDIHTPLHVLHSHSYIFTHSLLQISTRTRSWITPIPFHVSESKCQSWTNEVRFPFYLPAYSADKTWTSLVFLISEVAVFKSLRWFHPSVIGIFDAAIRWLKSCEL